MPCQWVDKRVGNGTIVDAAAARSVGPKCFDIVAIDSHNGDASAQSKLVDSKAHELKNQHLSHGFCILK